MSQNRRGFITTTGGLVLASGATLTGCALRASDPSDPWRGLKVGVASYSLRKFSLDEAIAMTRELGVKYIALKSFHLKLDSTTAERKAAARKIKDAGLILMGGGVISMKKEADVVQAFEYASDAGMPVIIGKPNPELLPLIEKHVKKTDIRLAIHNHGPGDNTYPSPRDAYEAVEGMDKRMGLCIDVGHTARNGDDEAKMIVEFADRLHDVHIKDVTARKKEGKTVEIGAGVVNTRGVLEGLLKTKYRGHVALEFEKDADAPMPGMKQSFAEIRKVLAEIKSA